MLACVGSVGIRWGCWGCWGCWGSWECWIGESVGIVGSVGERGAHGMEWREWRSLSKLLLRRRSRSLSTSRASHPSTTSYPLIHHQHISLPSIKSINIIISASHPSTTSYPLIHHQHISLPSIKSINIIISSHPSTTSYQPPIHHQQHHISLPSIISTSHPSSTTAASYQPPIHQIQPNQMATGRANSELLPLHHNASINAEPHDHANNSSSSSSFTVPDEEDDDVIIDDTLDGRPAGFDAIIHSPRRSNSCCGSSSCTTRMCSSRSCATILPVFKTSRSSSSSINNSAKSQARCFGLLRPCTLRSNASVFETRVTTFVYYAFLLSLLLGALYFLVHSNVLLGRNNDTPSTNSSQQIQQYVQMLLS